jgi:hypothetical protein
VTQQQLELLVELQRADSRCAVALAELDELIGETAAVRERADAVGELLASGPEERARVTASVAEAEEEADERRRALGQAEAELSAAEAGDDEERLAAARRFHVRARDAAAVADKRLAARRLEERELGVRLETAEQEAPRIEQRARQLGAALRGRPRLAAEAGRDPRPGLRGVAEWASAARAALLVARAEFAIERDGVLRQANELGSVLVGEPLAASSAAAVVRRVESVDVV